MLEINKGEDITKRNIVNLFFPLAQLFHTYWIQDKVIQFYVYILSLFSFASVRSAPKFSHMNLKHSRSTAKQDTFHHFHVINGPLCIIICVLTGFSHACRAPHSFLLCASRVHFISFILYFCPSLRALSHLHGVFLCLDAPSFCVGFVFVKY